MLRTLTSLVAALAILAVACSDSESPSTATATDAQTSEEQASAVASEPSPDEGEPADADAAEEIPGPAQAEGSRGVSADTIKLGISIFDLSAIGRDNGDVPAKYQAAIDAINSSGGVLGRKIEPVFAEFSPLDTASADAACVQLTQDEEVFAVVGAQNGDYVLCFTELHDTIFLSPQTLTSEQVARSVAPALSVAASGDLPISAGIEAMAAEGAFDGARVAVHASFDGADLLDAAVGTLSELGVGVVSKTISTDLGGDLVAIRSEMSVFAQRWAADGAAVVVTVGDAGNLEAATALGDAGLDITLASTQPAVDATVYENYGADISGLEGAVATSTFGYADMYEQDLNGVRECVTRFEQASGETVNIRPETGEVANLTTTVWACQLIELFAQIAEAAGADLTNDSFRGAFESAAELRATALTAGSGGPGKSYIDDSPPVIVMWDADARDFVVR